MTKISTQTVRKKIPDMSDTVFGGDVFNDGSLVRYDIESLAALINGFDPTNPEYIQRFSAEPIPSYTPVAIIDNLAYKLDASNPLHKYAFAGFSLNGTNVNQYCHIKESGEVTLQGWGLFPNTQYLAGANGTIITENTSNTNFTKIIGYARDEDTLEIIKNSITVNK
jgi:hypothetical protein